jgi:hypothetical protein
MNDVTRDDINSLACDIFDLKDSLKYILQDIIDNLQIDINKKTYLLQYIKDL